MNKYTWYMTPDLTDIDLDNLYNYSCYDDKCLISTFFIDAICDFLEEKKISCYKWSLDDKYRYVIVFDTSETIFNNIQEDLIKFKTGKFRTTSIYKLEDATSNTWIKLYKNKQILLI